MSEKTLNTDKCQKIVYPNERWGSFHGYQCTKSLWKDGFCKVHHPKSVEKRHKESKETGGCKME